MDRTPDIVFDDLLLSLKKEGFAPNLDDYLEFTALFNHFEGERADLKYYLAPVICRNKEDQEKFYEIYDRYYSKTGRKPAPIVKPPPPAPPSSKPNYLLRALGSFYFWLSFSFFLAGTIKIIPLLRRHSHAVVTPKSPETPDPGLPSADAAPKRHQRVFVVKPMSPSADTGELKSAVIPFGKPIEKENTVHSTAFAWLVVLGLACLGLSTSFFPQKRSRLLPQVDLDTKKGDDTPMELPF